MKIKDFTIQFEKDEFKPAIQDILTHDISRKFDSGVVVTTLEACTTITIKGDQDFDKIREVIGLFKYWQNVQ